MLTVLLQHLGNTLYDYHVASVLRPSSLTCTLKLQLQMLPIFNLKVSIPKYFKCPVFPPQIYSNISSGALEMTIPQNFE